MILTRPILSNQLGVFLVGNQNSVEHCRPVGRQYTTQISRTVTKHRFNSKAKGGRFDVVCGLLNRSCQPDQILDRTTQTTGPHR